MSDPSRKILVLGASGLIGRYVTDDLPARSFEVIGVARRFATSQRSSALDLEMPVMSMASSALARLLRDRAVDVVVNCLGVLQDGPGSNTRDVHRDFVARLLQAIGDSGRAIRLIHISIPGGADEDRTAFAATKREAERLIAASGIAYAILRPGFVIAPAAYGGSAMVRALAAFPFDLPAEEAATPFQPVAVEDLAGTIAWLAVSDDPAANTVTWDLMRPQRISLSGVIDQFRFAFGTAHWTPWREARRPREPSRLDAADAFDCDRRAAPRRHRRSRALDGRDRDDAEDDRANDRAAFGHDPGQMVRPVVPDQGAGDRKPGAVLVRLGLHRPGDLISRDQGVLADHGFPRWLVAPLAGITSLMDISIGVLIAFRRTCATGLVAGILLSLGYMAGTALLTPDLWVEPLGALVKTGPAIVLMLVALPTLDNR
jgi:uncharacterized protein YbjT (DUF2867 family)